MKRCLQTGLKTDRRLCPGCVKEPYNVYLANKTSFRAGSESVNELSIRSGVEFYGELMNRLRHGGQAVIGWRSA